VDGAVLAVAFPIVAALSLSAVYVAYEEYLSPIAYKMGDPLFAEQVDLSVLSPICEPRHIDYDHDITAVTLLFALSWWPFFSFLKRHRATGAIVRVAKILSGAVVLVGFVMMVASWHFLWVWYEPLTVDGEKGYVLSEKADQMFVYIPLGQKSRVVSESDPGVDRDQSRPIEHLLTGFERARCP